MGILIVRILIYAIFLIFFTTKDAYAYLDPGSGSYLFQLLMATFLGMLFVFKTFWRRIIDIIRKFFI